ncbi:MAG TPA: DinB family protein [Ignavibacteria bacterium]|nr:DinB family protein [Ignavibacteria bacterium]
MALKEALKAELEQEMKSTREMLKRSPEKDFEKKPHEKSMTLGELASHVANTNKWISLVVDKDEYDFVKENYSEKTAKSNEELMKIFDDTLAGAIKSLENTTDEELMKGWKLRAGDQIFFELPKVAALRTMAYSHLYHHRGQLSVYLRLHDVPLPSVYGPTADNPMN